DESYAEYCARMSEITRNESAHGYAERPDMPYFWARQNLQKPEEKSIAFAYSFLGIRIQCAQCHKHPFDQWSKADFDDFRNFFGTVRSVPNGAPPGDRAAQADYKKIVEELGMTDTKLNGNQLRQEFIKKLNAGKTVPFPEVIAGKVAAN